MRRYFKFMVLLLLAGCRTAATGQQSLDPPVLLPDGTEFKSWEMPLKFSRTYCVDQRHASADDANPGTEEKPLKTIQAAADLAQPGERVVVKSGIYRETIRVPRGGTGAGAMISYEAAPDAEVIVKGSDIVPADSWRPAEMWARNADGGTGKIWWCELEWRERGEGSPFARFNRSRKRKPVFGFISDRNHMRRGLVFQDGKLLKQVMSFQDMLREAGTYWVQDPVDALIPRAERDRKVKFILNGKLKLFMRPYRDVAPADTVIEITKSASVFTAAERYTGYIRVNGFVFEHAASCFPRPQHGIVSTHRGHHWIIEDNTVRWANSLGMDIGMQWVAMTGKEGVCTGFHIVRRNRIEHCGVGGLGGSHGNWEGTGDLVGCLIEDNVFVSNGWQGCETTMECAAIKLHGTRDCVVRRNVILDSHQASGIWFDWPEGNSRITQNLIMNVGTIRAGIFMEGSHLMNIVDNNVIAGVRIDRDTKAYPRRYGGFGIKSDHTDNLVVAHNLIMDCEASGLELGHGERDRTVKGKLPTATNITVYGNIVLNCSNAVEISNVTNRIDHNLYGGIRSEKGWKVLEPAGSYSFTGWREAGGFDGHSVARSGVSTKLDRRGLRLSLDLTDKLPEVPRIRAVTRDFYGRPLPAGPRSCGPFGGGAVAQKKQLNPRPQ